MKRPIQCVVLLLTTFGIVAGCSHAARNERMSPPRARRHPPLRVRTCLRPRPPLRAPRLLPFPGIL